MKYYISKPKSHELDIRVVDGIKAMDSEAQLTDTLCEADICVFQSGWTKSKLCIADYLLARDKRIERRESYIYTEKFKVKLN